MRENLLFEIATEELPAKSFPDVLNQMSAMAEKLFIENRMIYESIETYATPRRLVLWVNQMETYQEALDELIRGPQQKIAFDDLGHLSKAGLGFLKNNQLDASDLFIDSCNGVEYVYARKKYPAHKVVHLLEVILPQIIDSITFEKSMRWGDYNVKFARPIRGIVALLGQEIIHFSMANVFSSNITKGHRALSNTDIIIPNADDYFKILKDHYVIIDQNERAQMIRQQINQIALDLKATVLIEEALLHEVTYLVEYPTAIRGDFDSDFLKLPKVVVTTPMIEHQRYFPVLDANNQLLPHFIVIRNGGPEYAGSVRKNNERVLRARLSDAKFFFDEDLKTPLSDKVSQLKNIVYQEGLGTVYEKIERIAEISTYIANNNIISPENLEMLKRAVFLSKADLVTHMVGEFDELQGLMGKEYALINGEKKEVAQAIFSHYLPRFSGDATPDDLIGQIVSIADKLDTLIGFFAIGLHPTGSQDPYGLRRQAIGLIRTVLASDLSINMDMLIDFSCDIYKNQIVINKEQVIQDIHHFLKLRLKIILADKGYRSDVIDAVSQNNLEVLDILNSKVVVLSQSLSDHIGFKSFITAFNRVINLLSTDSKNDIDTTLLSAPDELKLYKQVCLINNSLPTAISKGLFSESIDILCSLTQPINDFLDNTKIFVDDLAIRANRLALLRFVYFSCSELCDFSKLKCWD